MPICWQLASICTATSVHDVVDPALGVAHHLDAIPPRVLPERTLVLATLIDVEITDVAIPRVVGICLASYWPKAFVFPASINELGECRVSRIG